jgi:glycosyltransferase involved in cell wall biosynthesis
VVGISKYILDKHLSSGWFPRADRSVIFNSFVPQPTIDLALQCTRPTFGYLGRIDRRKGIEWLLESFADTSVSNFASLVIAGEGEPEYVESLRSRFASQSVKFVGRVTQEDFFSRIDVAVIPSIINEALGRVIIEAYAFQKPVIASQRGGIPEIVDDGRTGFLVDPERPEQLVERFRQFIADPKLAAKFGPFCLARYEEFRPDRIADAYLDVYIAALCSRGRYHQRPTHPVKLAGSRNET